MDASLTAATHGDLGQALRHMNASLVLHPLNAGTHQVRGMTLYMMGDYVAAEAALRNSVAINPEIDGSYLILGFIQVLRDQREAAAKEFAAEPDSTGRDAGLAIGNHAIPAGRR
jgi:Flp pilus assembly protein TadD